MTRAVLDTNVLAPGFVGTTSVSARLISLWRERAYTLVISEHILGELARAYSDPYYRSRVSADQASRIIGLLRSEAHLATLTVPVSGVATQPKEDLVISSALSGGATLLATRDRQLLKIETYRNLQIVPPGRLLALLVGEE